VAAEHVVHAVAAGLRRELALSRGFPRADLELAEACDQVLDQRDDERGIDALTTSLVHFLEEAAALTNELVLAAANEGEVGFVAEVLARRGAVPVDAAMEELLSGEPRRIMTLLRVCQSSHELAAGLLAGIGDILGISDAGEAIATFEGLTKPDVEATRAWLLTSSSYRAALERLGQGHG
jgi:hypothetical protein